MNYEQPVGWEDWQPGLLDSDSRRLGDVYSTLPGFAVESFPKIVERYEDPTSPDAFPGSISLERHDCLHVLLGRGLLNQDEAFVIGFTMGAARGATFTRGAEFQHIASKLYPPPFRWSLTDLRAFRIAFAFAHHAPEVARDFHLFPFEMRMEDNISELRRLIGVKASDLRTLFAYEKLIIPGSQSSLRLSP